MNASVPGGPGVAPCLEMKRVPFVLGAWLAVCGAACGGDDGPAMPDAGPTDLVGKLEALDGVSVQETPTSTAGYTFYVLRFTQPVDHEDPDGPSFEQRVSLLHKDEAAPMVALTSGYWDYYVDNTYELTRLLRANQISIEHRFFGESRPEPADWTKLTIRQMADDEHRIITELRKVYPGAFLTTGGSKGGMTAVYHRRFYPGDVDGTVPYVAPISFGAPDPRYPAFLDSIGTASCRNALRAAATEMLQNRRAAMLSRAQSQASSGGHAYTRIQIGAAVEGSIASLEWAFWQYFGAPFCGQVPAPTATDDGLWDFLDRVAPVTDSDDDQIAAFEAYYYQAYAQLGYPDAGAAYLDPYLMYSDADYETALPTPVPAYDAAAAMRDIDTWVKTEGTRLLFVYGEWDPWTGGPFELGAATDSLLVVQPQGSHGARMSRLAAADRDAAFAKLAAWSGVTPMLPPQPRTAEAPREPREPRVPPVMVRALRARR